MAKAADECEAMGYYFKYALSNGGDGGFFRDNDNAVLIASCDLAILFIDSRVELIAFALEAVLVGACLLDVAGVAAAGALEGGGEGREEEEGEVGLDVVADGAVHGEDAVGAEVAAGALVGLGAVGVAIAEDDGSVGEGGEDDLVEGLGAVGEHEGHLGFGGDVAESGFAAGVEQDGADAVAEGRTAGLAECDDGVAVGFECGREELELRGFAGAVEAFEGDEKASVQGGDGCLAHDASLLQSSGGLTYGRGEASDLVETENAAPSERKSHDHGPVC